MRTYISTSLLSMFFAVFGTPVWLYAQESAAESRNLLLQAESAFAILSSNAFPGDAPRLRKLRSQVAETVQKAGETVRRLARDPRIGDANAYTSAMQDQLIVLAHAYLAMEDDGRSDVDQLVSTIEARLAHFVAVSTAVRWITTDLMQNVLPQYVSMLATEDAPMKIIQKCETASISLLKDMLLGNNVSVRFDNVDKVVPALVQNAKPKVIHEVVANILYYRAEERINSASAMTSPALLQQAREHAQSRSYNLATEPYTLSRIDQWSSILVSEVSRILAGENIQSISASDTGQKTRDATSRSNRGFAPPRTQNASGSGDRMVGLKIITTRERRITIPQGSHGNCYLLHGIEPEIGGKNGIPAMFSLIHQWRGPNNSYVNMRNLRLFGTCSAMAGASRVSVQLNAISYVLRNGRAITQSISGYIVDAESSQEGIPGDLRLNLEKVAPWALLSSGAKGFADAMKANTTVEVLSGLGSKSVTQTGDRMENAWYGALGTSASFAAGFFDKILQDIKPTVRVEAGRRVTAFITAPVVFDIPEEEFLP